MAEALDFPQASLPSLFLLLSPTPLCSIEGQKLGLDLWKQFSPTLYFEALVGRLPSLHHVVEDTYRDSGSATPSTPVQVVERQESSGLLSSVKVRVHGRTLLSTV